MGVHTVDDLTDVCGDVDILRDMHPKISAKEFKKLLKACQHTDLLKNVSLPVEMTALTLLDDEPDKSLEHSWSVLSASDPMEEEVQRRLAATQARLNALKAPRQKSEIIAAEARIREIQEEINRLESGGAAMESKKVSATLLEREKQKREAKEKLVATQRRWKLIGDLQRDLLVSASLDVVFVLDTTGSMEGYINAARDNMNQLVDGLSRLYPDIPLRVAFVGYKDHCNGLNRLSVLHFTNSINTFRVKLSDQRARGGCGRFADVLGEFNFLLFCKSLFILTCLSV